MKAYAALMTGIDTQLKIFKTFDEAKTQVYAWFGESMLETIKDEDSKTWNEIFSIVDSYEEKENHFSIFDDTIETCYEVIEVNLPFAAEPSWISFGGLKS